MKKTCPKCGAEMRYHADGPGNAWGSKPYPLYQCSGCSFWRRESDFDAIRKVFAFDVESDGLWGNPFAIGAVVKYLESGVVIDRFQACLPDSTVKNKWVIDNVLPALEMFHVTHENRESMISDFAKFYMDYKKKCDIICHIPIPVESNLISEMHRLHFIGEFDAPFPLIDVAPMLDLIGENPLSVDSYIKKHQLTIKGMPHNPLYDAEAACEVYRHIILSK